ncbi:hypothetical protein BDA99DRAFT_575536, partial [Phascolomyces articulosus]
MYIEYENVQFVREDGKKYARRSQPPKILPIMLPKPKFMPTKLVRISDMKIVNGSQVNGGYCALSYSWNQSGDIKLDKTTGKSQRIDEGKHQIISYDTIFPDMIIPQYKTDWNKRLQKIYRVFKIMEDKNYYFSKTIQYVKFEGIIQQICRKFNIKYIWYDQMCISQDDKEERRREIRNMHRIYGNAYCTVALAPDYSEKYNLNIKQEYFKRLWTLEEIKKSKRLLFVGKNIHMWEKDITGGSIYPLIKPLSELSVNEVLYHAHQRTSTKEHDRVFALINLFPEFIDQENDTHSFKNLMIRYFCGVFPIKK